MFENKGKNEQNSVPKDEIDDFAQALLDKKTEMALYKDEPEEKKEIAPEERKQAEQTLSSALDMLRKERGQKTIKEEEIEFSIKERQINDTVEDDDDFTTSSLHSDDLLNNSLQNVHNALADNKTSKKKKSHTKKTKHKESDSEPKPKKEPEQKKESQPKKVDPKRKKRNILIAAFISVVLLLMAGYAYKIYVYDPQNVITEAQQESYDKLVAYADEWEMMSDTEKLEILDMKEDYDSLLEKQKTSINEYFTEQTGKNYTTIYKEMQTLKQEQEDEANPDYQEIVSYLTNWSSKSDDEKMNILNLKSKYDNLSSGLQKKVDTLSREQASKSFGSLYTDYEAIKAQQDQQAQQEAENQKNEQISYYQSLINQANTELQNYVSYSTTLQQDLQAAQAAGQDTSEIQSQIDMNNQLIAQYQATIESYQNTINSIQ